MSPAWGPEPLRYHRVGHADLGMIASLELDSEQVARFLDPLDHILTQIRGGPAHALFAIEAEQLVVGFYVLHPDRRDNSCWWLGWFAFDRRQQGRGYGRRAMARIMASFRRIPGCRRARLFVAPDNHHAMRLYAKAGFRRVGETDDGDFVLEATLPDPVMTGNSEFVIHLPSTLARRTRRRCPRRSPPDGRAAQAAGRERGPPPSHGAVAR
jgi:RimJ/RimL family protein N-acetyltransferase